MTTPGDVVDSVSPLSSSSIIVFVILFLLVSPRLRSVVNVYNFNRLPSLEVAAYNVPTLIDQGHYKRKSCHSKSWAVICQLLNGSQIGHDSSMISIHSVRMPISPTPALELS